MAPNILFLPHCKNEKKSETKPFFGEATTEIETASETSRQARPQKGVKYKSNNNFTSSILIISLLSIFKLIW